MDLAEPDGGAELTADLAARIAPLLAQRIEGLAEQAPSELSAGNLRLFRGVHRWRFHDGAWPCIGGVGYDGLRQAIPLFDVRAASQRELDALLDRHGCLAPLCGREAQALQAQALRLEQHRDDADYVYTAFQFQRYAGRALQKKANLMTQFLAAHRVSAEPFGPHQRAPAAEILDVWMRDKGKAAGEADEAPCREAITAPRDFGLDGFLYRADGEPAGFVLAEELQPGVWVIRFAKGLLRCKGIAPYMFHHFASRGDRRVDWLNFEHDLGLPNFRRTKLSYRPTLLLPKWRALPAHHADQFPQDAAAHLR
ncbi:MAG: phosphatidylglycerol lysyltransferase domain-containing protein [Rubrivivax sp.]